MEKVIELNWYGESQIDINIQVLQSDGSELAVVINAVSLALMDAGIRMKDFVVAASIGNILTIIFAHLSLWCFHLFKECLIRQSWQI